MLDDDQQNALDVLGDSLRWQLPARRWGEIEEVVSTMEQALAEANSSALRRATTDLELLGPTRGASAENPPPETDQDRVRDRINQLITSLLAPRSEQPPTGDDRE